MSSIQSQQPTTLSYASTPYGYYRKIGGGFTVGKVKWFGPVIAGPEALYLLKVQRQNSGGGAHRRAHRRRHLGGTSEAGREPQLHLFPAPRLRPRPPGLAREEAEEG